MQLILEKQVMVIFNWNIGVVMMGEIGQNSLIINYISIK